MIEPEEGHTLGPEYRGWPALSDEERPWKSKFDRDQLTRRQSTDYAGPYRSAVVPEIARLPVLLDSIAAAHADDASTALAKFDSELGAVSTPFASILLRSESASSSQIEQLTSGARAIAEAELGERETGNAALIVRNIRALQAALDLSDRIDNDSIIAMQDALLGAHVPGFTGKYRDEQVWIGGTAIGPHTATFTPPHHDRVQANMDDLVRFIERDDVPVLAQAAIAHAQFETIHPFPDGNGRTGRALVQAMLRQKGLTTHVSVPVSAGLLHSVDAYYEALNQYRRGSIAPIVIAFSEAAVYAVASGRQLAGDITAIRVAWETKMTGLRSDAAARRVATLAIEQPVLNQQLIRARLGITPTSAYRALDALVAGGIIHAANSKKRNRIWIANEIIQALDDFATRAGRRNVARL